MKSYSIEFKRRFATYIECLSADAHPKNEYDEHAHHDELEIYRFIEGELYFSFEGERIEVKNGDVIIVASGNLHRTIIRQPCRYFRKRLLVKNEFFASMPQGALELQKRLTQKGIIILDRDTLESSELTRVIDDIEASLKRDSDFDDFCAMTILSFFLIKAESIGGEIHKARYTLGKRAKNIIEYIDENITSPLDYSSIAKEFHISEKNLYKIFKTETGFALSRYIRIRRLIKAKSLLNSGYSPREAAEGAGFAEYTAFYRCFIKELGISPAKYISNSKIQNKL